MSAAAKVDALRLAGPVLELIDQRKLPGELVYVQCRSAAEVATAIRDMVVRGAPAIGCAAAFGIAREAGLQRHQPRASFDAAMQDAFDVLRRSRPTAVNLFWALDRMRARCAACAGQSPLATADDLPSRIIGVS